MSASEPIVCRPTPWFRYRAIAIFLMFAIFAVLFYRDGSTGYRKDNEAYYLHLCFKKSSHIFSEMNADRKLSPEQWREFAETQTVDLPEDLSIMPSDFQAPMSWPQILHDFEQMESLQWKQLWLDYSGSEGLKANPPEKPRDAKTIRDQWIVFGVCITFSAISLFLLIRTSRRSITATAESLISQDGREIPYSDMHRLDLRKWENKGLAVAEYEGASGKGRLRIDGLTYGGFKKEQGQPAEALMQRLRENFSGELLEYTTLVEDAEADDQSGTDGKPEV